MLDLSAVTSDWTLFLDRDGVINHEKHLDYIYRFDEFVFYEGVIEALRKLSEEFGKIIIVTNQKGVGKGLMTEADLVDIHDRMTRAIKAGGGRIDQIFYCTELDDDHPNRKPQPGMAYLAKKQFPAIDFNRSIMLGNRLSDMKFGRNAGMYTVYVETTHPGQPAPDPLIDMTCADLVAFAEEL